MTGLTANAAARHHSEHPLAALVVREGSMSHAHLRKLETIDNAVATRNASDAIHHFSMLHARYPGVIDNAAARTVSDNARRAMFALADGFAVEREFLARLVVAAGPIPSTPGQAETEASVVAQRHAIEMLAQSDRQGCAVGAAIALALDWAWMRTMLGSAARRFGVDVPELRLATGNTLLHTLDTECTTPGTERAAMFGAQQIAAQHRGLWDLLESRAHARGPY
jgi:hypothetical protein